MNEDTLKGQWSQLKGQLRNGKDRLTDGDIDQIKGGKHPAGEAAGVLREEPRPERAGPRELAGRVQDGLPRLIARNVPALVREIGRGRPPPPSPPEPGQPNNPGSAPGAPGQEKRARRNPAQPRTAPGAPLRHSASAADVSHASSRRRTRQPDRRAHRLPRRSRLPLAIERHAGGRGDAERPPAAHLLAGRRGGARGGPRRSAHRAPRRVGGLRRGSRPRARGGRRSPLRADLLVQGTTFRSGPACLRRPRSGRRGYGPLVPLGPARWPAAARAAVPGRRARAWGRAAASWIGSRPRRRARGPARSCSTAATSAPASPAARRPRARVLVQQMRQAPTRPAAGLRGRRRECEQGGIFAARIAPRPPALRRASRRARGGPDSIQYSRGGPAT